MGDTVNQAEEKEAPFPLTDVDKWILSQTDEEFKYHDWDELRQIIGMRGSFLSVSAGASTSASA